MANKLLKRVVIGVLIFVVIYLILDNNKGPTEPVTVNLTTSYTENSYQLYSEAIFELTDWIESQRKIHDSGDYFIFRNPLFRDLYFNPHKHIGSVDLCR